VYGLTAIQTNLKETSLSSIYDLTHEELIRQLRYDPETGLFWWIQKRVGVSRDRPAGCKDKTHGYIKIMINRKQYLGHRLAWFYMTGSWPEDEIDHEDLDGMNNKWGNLRPATGRQNQGNRPLSKNNTSGYKGVCYHKNNGKYMASIGINGKSNFIGYFATKEEAAKAYNTAAAKYFGEFAREK
jgi:hypothetical protein